jgi:hypothetical protein
LNTCEGRERGEICVKAMIAAIMELQERAHITCDIQGDAGITRKNVKEIKTFKNLPGVAQVFPE